LVLGWQCARLSAHGARGRRSDERRALVMRATVARRTWRRGAELYRNWYAHFRQRRAPGSAGDFATLVWPLAPIIQPAEERQSLAAIARGRRTGLHRGHMVARQGLGSSRRRVGQLRPIERRGDPSHVASRGASSYAGVERVGVAAVAVHFDLVRR